ncbi:MAG: bifunctional chorismate mutase/prephenate dehydrogenase, partial [Plesiomonas sp.]
MVPELALLRDHIDAVDREMLDLLTRRLALVKQVGEVKSRHGLPIYVPEREASMLAARRAEAQALGIPPDLIEDILRRVMRESYSSENDSGFKTVNPTTRPIVIIGGRGQLGQLFARLFTLSGYQVRVLDKDDWVNADALLDDAAMVLISVPISLTEAVIDRLQQLPTDCILADLTSVKQAPLQAMLAVHRGPVVGLHPMFGPDLSSLAKQVIVYCN